MTMPMIPIKMPRTPEIVASLACAPVQRPALRSRQVVCHHALLEALKLVLVDPASKKQACGVIAAVLDFLYRVCG